MPRRTNFEVHSFYCPLCGKKTFDLPRKTNAKQKSLHRKKLYCPWCKITVNQIEIQNHKEYVEFITAYEEGKLKYEAADSLSYVWDPSIG